MGKLEKFTNLKVAAIKGHNFRDDSHGSGEVAVVPGWFLKS